MFMHLGGQKIVFFRPEFGNCSGKTDFRPFSDKTVEKIKQINTRKNK